MFCGSLNRLGTNNVLSDLWVYCNQTPWCHNPFNHIVYHVLIHSVISAEHQIHFETAHLLTFPAFVCEVTKGRLWVNPPIHSLHDAVMA